MLNNTTIKIPKKYEDRINEIYHDSYGYWVYLNRGYCSYNWACHTIHEDTHKDILEEIRCSSKCDCYYCKDIENADDNGIL